MMNELLQVPSNLSVQDKVNYLESSIYNKTSDPFDFVPPPKKHLGGKNRRVNISIHIVIKKNLLLKELESVGDPLKKAELLGLLESVRSRLRSLRKGEHSKKLGGRENRLIICLIKSNQIFIWLVKESSTLGVMSS